MSNQPAVIVENLTKKYGSFTALDGLSMQLMPGRILGFIGPNGAGKTTAIKILVGLSRPTSGKATIDGVDCMKDPGRIKKLVGYMPDTFGSYDNMRVREYLDFFGAAFKIPRKRRLKRIGEVMDITGSTYMQDRFVEALSHGMKQRVGIARTLLHDPKVLILDEPANGLDPQARIEMRQILLRLAELGKTLIVTSHILPELSRICDTVAIITHGKLRAFGTLEDVMKSLTQRRDYEIELLEEPVVEPIAKAVRKLLPDAEVVASPTERAVRFSTEAEDRQLAAALKQIAGTGAPMVQFREVHKDLEDAFMEVTKDDTLASGDRA